MWPPLLLPPASSYLLSRKVLMHICLHVFDSIETQTKCYCKRAPHRWLLPTVADVGLMLEKQTRTGGDKVPPSSSTEDSAIPGIGRTVGLTGGGELYGEMLAGLYWGGVGLSLPSQPPIFHSKRKKRRNRLERDPTARVTDWLSLVKRQKMWGLWKSSFCLLVSSGDCKKRSCVMKTTSPSLCTAPKQTREASVKNPKICNQFCQLPVRW